MYLPALFAERDPQLLRAFLSDHPFGMLVAPGDPPEIAHLPFVFVPERDVLWGHVARANPIWRGFDGRLHTAVVQGPHGYISPRFYVSSQQVPTWNYAVVHVRGAPRRLDRDEEVVEVLRRLTSHQEAGPDAWTAEGLDPSFYADLRRAIVAFELPLAEVVGKFKLSRTAPQRTVRGCCGRSKREARRRIWRCCAGCSLVLPRFHWQATKPKEPIRWAVLRLRPMSNERSRRPHGGVRILPHTWNSTPGARHHNRPRENHDNTVPHLGIHAAVQGWTIPH